MAWGLYKNQEFLKPLCFSNGKTQEDVVKEVLNLINNGKKIIFVHGVCGTGKSAIALNLANELGKSSIVVPGKNLQAQYKRDYEGEKYLLKKNGERLKISVITGRNNHKCKFLEDNVHAIPKIRREINSKLNDIFSGVSLEIKEKEDDIYASNPELPCNIEMREKNWLKIKKYIGENKKVNPKNFSSVQDAKRMSVAPACPYWSPVLPEKYEIKSLGETKKRKYEGLDGNIFVQYKRKAGCPFYEQFDFYIDSDVIVFNSLKYKLETALLRKPKTEVEIIDECDEFLDSFSNERTINLDRLNNSLVHTLGSGEGDQDKVEELFELITEPVQTEGNLGIVPAYETTVENLEVAAEGERYEWTKMYPDFEEMAKSDKETEAIKLFGELKEVEEKHEERYIILAKKLDSKTLYSSDVELEWKCVNCGYIHKGKTPPPTCPLCKKPFSWYMPIGLVR